MTDMWQAKSHGTLPARWAAPSIRRTTPRPSPSTPDRIGSTKLAGQQGIIEAACPQAALRHIVLRPAVHLAFSTSSLCGRSPMPVCRVKLCAFRSGACGCADRHGRAGAADNYAGKTIELIVGAPPGGGYDIYARAVARHLGRHIPGEPTVVVKNMPGAGSAKAAQYIADHRAEGRHLDRRHHAGRDHGPAARRPHRAAVRPDQGALRRHRQQRHPRLRHAEERQDPEIRGRAEGEGEVRRQRAERLRPTNTATCTSTPRARCGTSCRAIAARPRWRSPWSAARSTASAAGTGRASARRSRTGCATTRPTC